MAPGAPAGAGRKRRQFRYAEFQAARSGRTEIRSDRRQRAGGDGDAGDDAHQRRRISRRPGAPDSFDQNRKAGFETRPAGNAVNLEDEMLKVSANQMDYAAVTSLYSRSLHLLKTAIGKA